MATIRDVAKRAGVSISTVSAAFNEGRVSDETKRRITDAARAVGYSPNLLAQSLKSGRSRLIALVPGDITNPFFGNWLTVIEKHALAANRAIIVSNTHGVAREQTVLELLKAQRVAGMLINPQGTGPEYRAYLEAIDVPLVTFDQFVPGLERDYVGTDNELAARMLTEYMLRLGHRQICFIGGQPGLWTTERRREGFVAAMHQAGLPIDEDLMLIANYEGDVAYRETTRLLTGPKRPTAILASNNVMALGALQAMIDLGFRCPQDISLTTIDDVPWMGLVKPRLTFAIQPLHELAAVAIKWLLERIESRDQAAIPPRRMILPPKIILGESCADLRV
ncbi:LacI family transcriptional regulator [Mesorhizobium sp. BR1-1-16]|uniref:LacI family DNA-binding transcriptional regulator n=1 Tax=Mesorhizobium sp. BR1-1-16 TaxID=2876653 RepID=UPI001CCF493F|nr:LacI family DNA-binding transcriptional regulator [Mesorhizobium sp. BR1-1-16]MBZ9937276.1 LacI family transcriptional regulator [Mesorhizobium sp. BR1-1-16]